MVAAQVMKCLWVASLAVAAPQLDFGAQRAVLTSAAAPRANQQEIVSNVVLALQPSIAEAVAAALRSSSVSSVSRSRPAVSTKSINSVEENYGPAKYNFEYKVAAKEDQTYISQNEQRDGDNVQGSYSYVDPEGSLITVNYEAGPMGYSATTDKQEGFVTVKERSSNKASGSAQTRTSGSRGSSRTSSSSASSSVNSADLIARIVASLQPQIQSAVSSALSSSSRSTSTTYVEQPRISSVSNGLEGTFGIGGTSVNIATPEFEINY